MSKAIHSMQNQVFTWSSSDNSRYLIDYNVATVWSGSYVAVLMSIFTLHDLMGLFSCKFYFEFE